MKTQIFAYKGNLGISIDMENGKFINNPTDSGQLGCVVDTTEIQITKEAKELIKRAKREGGSFADLMLTKHTSGGSSIGILGFGKVNMGTDFMIGRDCELSILDDTEEVELQIPEEYKEFIDTKK
jgi:hypothetical protein